MSVVLLASMVNVWLICVRGIFMLLINWNVQWAGSSKRPEIVSRIWAHKPEVICLTETAPDLLDGRGDVIHSGCDYGLERSKSDRCKVMLWSANRWRESTDDIGSKDKDFPIGRFVSGITQTSLGDLLIVGVCIPYMGARQNQGREYTQDHEVYLLELKSLLAELIKNGKPFVLVGDFNQCIGRGVKQSHVRSDLQNLLKAVLGFLEIPTAFPGFQLENHPSIDHIALHGLRADTCQAMEEDHANRLVGTDSPGHYGVVVDLGLASRI